MPAKTTCNQCGAALTAEGICLACWTEDDCRPVGRRSAELAFRPEWTRNCAIWHPSSEVEGASLFGVAPPITNVQGVTFGGICGRTG